MKRRVLVTGASGFVGTVLCDLLAAHGYYVRAAARNDRKFDRSIAEKVVVGEIGSRTNWSDAVRGVDYVIHAAARVHIMHNETGDAEAYMETNARGTERLAAAAAAAGVRRFVYISSAKVNGEEVEDHPYRADDVPRPRDVYGISKLAGENSLRTIAETSKLQIEVVRPPLVYGTGVRANFLRLMQLVDRELCMPLGSIRNRRSLVSVWNLADLLVNLLSNSAANGNVWMVSDGEDLSTPELIVRLASALGRRPRLFPVPVPILRALGRITGRSADISRLCGSLVVDVQTTCERLSWLQPMSVDAGLEKTAHWYLSKHVRHGR